MIERFETDRLALRPIRTDDVDVLVALDADPVVMRFLNGGRPTPRPEVDATVRRALGHRWMAFDRATDEFVGWFAMRTAEETVGERVLGYRLRRPAWGKGLATEGSNALIATTFTRTDAERVTAQTMTVNTASRRVMERCGLHHVRTFFLDWPDPIEGSDLGDVEYELTRADWERHQM